MLGQVAELPVDPGMSLPSCVDADLSVGILRDACASVRRLPVLKQARELFLRLKAWPRKFVSARPGLREEILRVAMAVGSDGHAERWPDAAPTKAAVIVKDKPDGSKKVRCFLDFRRAGINGSVKVGDR
eukprot:4922704-Amphidinium_carterae.3